MPLLTRMIGFLITNDAERATKFYRDVLSRADCQLVQCETLSPLTTLWFRSRHREPFIFRAGHHENDRRHALLRESDKRIDVGVSRPRCWKSRACDVDRADLLSVLDEAAHQRPELRFIIDAAQLRWHRGYVRENKTSYTDPQVTIAGQRSFSAADLPRELIATDSANECAIDEWTVDSVHRSESDNLCPSRSVSKCHWEQRNHQTNHQCLSHVLLFRMSSLSSLAAR